MQLCIDTIRCFYRTMSWVLRLQNISERRCFFHIFQGLGKTIGNHIFLKNHSIDRFGFLFVTSSVDRRRFVSGVAIVVVVVVGTTMKMSLARLTSRIILEHKFHFTNLSSEDDTQRAIVLELELAAFFELGISFLVRA